MRIALKVDVDTFRGTMEGVPALQRLFDQFNVKATFLFSLGPDHTGRAIKRVFRRGFLEKVGRTSVTSHYGIKTLLYGTLIPGPHIGRHCADIMRSVEQAGHETGIHTYDHILWQDYVANRGEDWTRRQMNKARESYFDVFHHHAYTHGAAGWQMNAHAFHLEKDFGFHYASDCRGSHPFIPVVDNKAIDCPQLPTTLPTLDEVIGCDGWTEDNVHQYILNEAKREFQHGHVYTLHAELEGMKLIPVMRRLLEAWRSEGYTIGSTQDLFASLDINQLPKHHIEYRTITGRSGTLAVQGKGEGP